MYSESEIEKAKEINVSLFLERIKFNLEEVAEYEGKIIKLLGSDVDPSFVVNIIRNKGLTTQEKMNIFFKEENSGQ